MKERRKERKKDRKKEGKKERRKERKIERKKKRKKDGRKERKKDRKKERNWARCHTHLSSPGWQIELAMCRYYIKVLRFNPLVTSGKKNPEQVSQHSVGLSWTLSQIEYRGGFALVKIKHSRFPSNF